MAIVDGLEADYDFLTTAPEAKKSATTLTPKPMGNGAAKKPLTAYDLKVLRAMGPGKPWLRLKDIKHRLGVQLGPGQFYPDIEIALMDLVAAGEVLSFDGKYRRTHP